MFKALDFAITSYCQAGCPCCARYGFKTDDFGTKEDLLVPLKHMDQDIFESIIYKNKLLLDNKKKQIIFCGEYGDPMMHPKVYEFCEYIINNLSCFIKINTNGGIRSKEYYKKLATLDKRIYIEFAIDGLNDDINHRYRKNVNTAKAFENMKYFNDNVIEKYQTTWKYLIFDYNYQYVGEVIDKAIDMNINKLFLYINNRDWFKLSNDNFKRMLEILEPKPKMYTLVGEYRTRVEG